MFLEIQPTVVSFPLEKFGLLSIVVSFSADGGAAVESERAADITIDLFGYRSFAYSALASFRMGTSGSASFQSAKKSW